LFLALTLYSWSSNLARERLASNPWKSLHPEVDVASLVDSLRPKFDTFYSDQPRVSFDRCESGYILESEGPLIPNRFHKEGIVFGPQTEHERELLRKQGFPVSFTYQGLIDIKTLC
jgi:hypothetical protein